MSFQTRKSFLRLRNTIYDILDENREACDCPIDCIVDEAIRTLFHWFSIAPFERISVGRKQRMNFWVSRATRIRFICLFTVWFEWKQHIQYAADTQERMLLASSGYSPKWHYAELEEINCWIKSLFSLRRKSVLVASLKSDWTTDDRWTILKMLFILFWILTVQFTMQSMG